MNADDFEKRLQAQPLRQVPDEWRAQPLSTAQQAGPPQKAAPFAHRGAPSLLSTLRYQLSALLWPRPVAWAGLAAVWLVILGLNVSTREASPRVARHASPLSPQVLVAFQEQARVLAELIGPRERPVAEPKTLLPRPRSERRREFFLT
jgi:hypothetical protein